MQRQTAAAYGHSLARPHPQPVQNVLEVTNNNSDDSSSSGDSSDDGCLSPKSGMLSIPEMARCSRCQRTPSLEIQTRKTNMVQYGLNDWYCNRCAAMIAFRNG